MHAAGTQDVAPTTVAFAGSGGVRLIGEIRGAATAPTILFLHGSGQSSASWSRSAADLAADGWRTVSVDLRGHGRSDRAPNGSYALEDFRDDVLAILETIAAPAVLAGASMGGMVALLAAAKADAGSVRGVVLADSAHRADASGGASLHAFVLSAVNGYASPEEAAQALGMVQLGSGRPPDPERLRHVLRQADGRYWWHWDPAYGALWTTGDTPDNAERVLAAAQRARCPILLVRGAESALVTDEIATEFCTRVRDVERLDLVGVGHMLSASDNAKYVEAMRPFLDRARSQP